MKKLKDICEINSGFSFRGKVENHPNGVVAVIQMKDLEHSYTKIGNELTYIDSEGIKDKYFLANGDILFVSKGSNNKAVLFDLDVNLAIASSTFFVLRVKDDSIDPAFLAWVLNHPDTQNHLKASLSGTYTLNLNRKAVEEILIPIPTMKKQKIIASLDALQKKEAQLYLSLMHKREAYFNTLLLNSIHA